MKSVPFLDLASLNGKFESEFLSACRRVLESGWYVQGDELRAFESEFAAYCGASYCIGVGNGLDALTLILRAYVALGRLPAGSEVILPANTFIATALAVVHAGLVPVLAEPSPDTQNVSVDSVKAAINDRTGAVMPVHLYGRLAQMGDLRALCNSHGLLLIEDAAQAHGAALNNRRAGTFGDAAGFSFFPGKNLGALGDGGAIVTDDEALAQCVLSLRNYGSTRKYQHDHIGTNSRLDELQAAFLRVKLRKLDEEVAHREGIAQRYLRGIVHPLILLPQSPEPEEQHAWHLFVVRSDARDALQRHLEQHAIETLIHYPTPIHRQKAFSHQLWPDLPVADALARTVLSLPLNSTLTDVQAVIDACNAFGA